ncbi:hypothetical protein PRN20_22110 [Devosia sp. ZB163]|uniref:hypothetical protein n=1 Tax=Devosia sp. ZB163 TaxID=3025938 RepID=UPI002362D8AC|nr:hypothetical protein [Devosia sp. ZB163]MDC9826440.1 hypothetical protein [Devosia sp. ZB163]
MVPTLDRTLLQHAMAHPVNWRGRSGRYYALEPLRLEDFRFAGDELYLIALGPHVLWAGGAADLVEDAVSRARFRLAMDCADRVFHVETSTDAIERLTVVWDLEGAEPILGLSAA